MIRRWARAASTLAVTTLILACGDDAFGPNLTDRWGGTGAALDATQTPPSLQLACGLSLQFHGPIPLTTAGAFTVQADAHSGNVVWTGSFTVDGRLTGVSLLLTVEFSDAPPGTPPQEFVLYRGRDADFSGTVCAVAGRIPPVPLPACTALTSA